MRRLISSFLSAGARGRPARPSGRRISVVIPSYNHARYIGQAISSVLDQDHAVDELIVVDDHSGDDSGAVIREVVGRYAGPVRIAVEMLPENVGAHRAIETGLSLARGDVLTILNSDDAFAPDRIRTILGAVPPEGDFIAFTGVDFIDGHGARLVEDDPVRAWYRDVLAQARACPTVGFALMRHNIAVTSGNLVFSRGLHARVGPFAAYRMCHDWDFLIRCLHHVEPIYVPSAHLLYRTHPTNTLKSTGNLMYSEGSSALKGYLSRVGRETPANRLAPSPHHWPLYFDVFVRTYASWYSGETIRQAMLSPASGEPDPGCAWLADASLPGADGFLTAPASEQDALALRRTIDRLVP